MIFNIKKVIFVSAGSIAASFMHPVLMADELPIADSHIHYSHDSVELTPPERVIEIMREANLKFALVSSSDDNGTQLLSDLAPDLIIPGLRPYRRRGELSTWFTDDAALAYVEKLLSTNRYASIGEFHLSGDDADLPIPRRIVELADEYNLVLHAHSDADAVERLLSQSATAKVLWAHSGFESPASIAEMLEKHDRLWADLAFRSEVGSGGQLSQEWINLFTQFPDRLMLGTDTYTPERMYYIPEHATNARTWLTSLPADLAEKVAWKNAHDLIMPIWEKNRADTPDNQPLSNESATSAFDIVCKAKNNEQVVVIDSGDQKVVLRPLNAVTVGEPISVALSLCGQSTEDTTLALDATMPAHGHGTNYQPEHKIVNRSEQGIFYEVEGVVLHMPGKWQWQVDIQTGDSTSTVTHDFIVE